MPSTTPTTEKQLESEPIGTARLTGDQIRELVDIFRFCMGRKTLPVLNFVQIQIESGRISVTGTDLDNWAIFRTPPLPPATGLAAKLLEARSRREDGVFLISIHFLKNISRCTAAVITGLTRGGGKICTVEAQVTLPDGTTVSDREESLPISQFPKFAGKLPNPESTISVGDSMLTAIRHAMECSSDDPTRYVLQSVAFDGSEKDHHAIAASDGRRLYTHNSQVFPWEDVRLLPKSMFTAPLNKTLAIPGWELTLPSTAKNQEEDWVKIVAGCWEFLMRATPGIFPNYKQCLPADDPSASIVFSDDARKDLIKTLASLPAWKKAHAVMLAVSNSQCQLTIGHATIPFKGAITTGEVRISFNPEFFISALNQGFTRIDLYGSESPARFSSGPATLILMPFKTA